MTEVQMVFYGSCSPLQFWEKWHGWNHGNPKMGKDGTRLSQTLPLLAKRNLKSRFFPPRALLHTKQKEGNRPDFFHNRQKKVLKVEEALQPILTVFGGLCKCQQTGLKVVGNSSDLINGNEQISKELFKTFYWLWQSLWESDHRPVLSLMKKVPQTECQQLYHYTNSAAEFCNGTGKLVKVNTDSHPATFSKFCNKCAMSLFPVGFPWGLIAFPDPIR